MSCLHRLNLLAAMLGVCVFPRAWSPRANRRGGLVLLALAGCAFGWLTLSLAGCATRPDLSGIYAPEIGRAHV